MACRIVILTIFTVKQWSLVYKLKKVNVLLPWSYAVMPNLCRRKSEDVDRSLNFCQIFILNRLKAIIILHLIIPNVIPRYFYMRSHALNVISLSAVVKVNTVKFHLLALIKVRQFNGCCIHVKSLISPLVRD